MSDMSNDVKIKRLIRKYGAQGYGLYNYVLELVVRRLDENSPLPDLEESSGDIAADLNIDTVLVEEIIWFCIEQGLFEQDEVSGRILASKIYKFLEGGQTRSERLKAMIRAYKDGLGLSQTVSDGLGLSEREEKRLEETRREEKYNTAAENGSRDNEPVDNSESQPDPFADLPDPEPEPEPEPRKPASEHQQLVDAAMALHEQATGSKYAFSGEDGKHLQQVRKKIGFDEAMTRLRRYYTGEYWFTEDGQYSIRQFHRHVNELASGGARASPTPEDRAAARKEYLARMYPERYGQEVST